MDSPLRVDLEDVLICSEFPAVEVQSSDVLLFWTIAWIQNSILRIKEAVFI